MPKAFRPSILCCGLATHDQIFALDRIPHRSSKFRARDFRAVGGGTAATAAVAVARLGGEARLVTQLGDDPIGDIIVRELRNEGVDCDLVRRVGGCTSSISAVLVDAAGERLIVNHVDPGLPQVGFWLAELPAGLTAVLADVRWPEASAAVLGLARQAGIPAILDGDEPGPSPAQVAAASLVAFSAGGLAGLTGEAGVEAGLRRAAAMSDAVMMATDGANGVFWLEGSRLRHVAAFQVPALDTLGAGDVFHGALALAVAEGRDLHDAAVFASAAAALKVTRFGGRAGTPTRAEVDAFLSHRTGG